MDLPPTTYGYWVSPTGEFHPVDDQMHIGFARRTLGKAGGGEGARNDDWRVDLLEAGWTRVAVHSGLLSIQFPPKPVAPRVIRRLHALINHTYYEGLLCIAIEDNLTGEYAGGATAWRRDPNTARAWVRLARQRGVSVRFEAM